VIREVNPHALMLPDVPRTRLAWWVANLPGPKGVSLDTCLNPNCGNLACAQRHAALSSSTGRHPGVHTADMGSAQHPRLTTCSPSCPNDEDPTLFDQDQ